MWVDCRSSLSTVYNDGEFSNMWVDYRGPLSTVYNDGEFSNMWVDYRGPLSTEYNDGEISTCGQTIEVHSVQSTMMESSQTCG